MSLIFVYVTTSSENESKKIAKNVINKNLAACANYFPIKSMYKWKGKLMNDKEFVLILKTVNSKFVKLKKEVERIHSYDIPCITKIKVEPNEKYGDWLKKAC